MDCALLHCNLPRLRSMAALLLVILHVLSSPVGPGVAAGAANLHMYAHHLPHSWSDQTALLPGAALCLGPSWLILPTHFPAKSFQYNRPLVCSNQHSMPTQTSCWGADVMQHAASNTLHIQSSPLAADHEGLHQLLLMTPLSVAPFLSRSGNKHTLCVSW